MQKIFPDVCDGHLYALLFLHHLCAQLYLLYTHAEMHTESVLEASKANDGKHLNCTFSFAWGFFCLCSKALRHLVFVLLSFLLYWFQITEGLKETPNDTRRWVARWRECLLKPCTSVCMQVMFLDCWSSRCSSGSACTALLITCFTANPVPCVPHWVVLPCKAQLP